MKNGKQIENPNEKRDSRFIFACIAGILYIVPCLSCLAFGILSDGMSYRFVLAIVTAVASLPISLIGLSCYKKKSGRMMLTAAAMLHIALHIATAIVCSTWYIILIPSLILTAIIITSSKAVEK